MSSSGVLCCQLLVATYSSLNFLSFPPTAGGRGLQQLPTLQNRKGGENGVTPYYSAVESGIRGLQ